MTELVVGAIPEAAQALELAMPFAECRLRAVEFCRG